MSKRTIDIVEKTLKKRYKKEKRFQIFGIASIATGIAALIFLIATIAGDGVGAFQQTHIKLDLNLDQDSLELYDLADEEQWLDGNYTGVIRIALRNEFPDIKKRSDKKMLYSLVSSGADFELLKILKDNPDWIGSQQSIWLPADDDVDAFIKGHIDRNLPENERRVKDNKIVLIDQLVNNGQLETQFNLAFFNAGDSREPELAGIRGALLGSFYTLLITLALSFPIGVSAAIYLEEFAPKNKFTDMIEVNINNLAAVPSVVFGLLGLAVFLNLFGLPRSIPLVGGIVLSLMTLPTIIISSRAALKAVPPSIREASLGLGASKMQTVFDHVVPLALPGMLTGSIIGMAQALGETAPLLMIGMVAFIVDIPAGIMDPATVLPVQIFLWSDSPERGFVEKTSGAILVLLFFLVAMNAIAVLLRRRFERKW